MRIEYETSHPAERILKESVAMKQLAYSIMLVVLMSMPGYANTTLDFGSTAGGSDGALTGSIANMTIDTGDMELVNLAPGDVLIGSRMVITPFDIGSKLSSSPATYDVTPQIPASGFQLELYNNIDGVGGDELILSADVIVDDLLTVFSTGTIGPTQQVDVVNLTLHNAGLMTSNWGFIPTVLSNMDLFGVGDLVINLSASGTDLTQAIDFGTQVQNINVTGSLTAVPEPGAVLLFASGILFMRRKLKYA